MKIFARIRKMWNRFWTIPNPIRSKRFQLWDGRELLYEATASTEEGFTALARQYVAPHRFARRQVREVPLGSYGLPWEQRPIKDLMTADDRLAAINCKHRKTTPARTTNQAGRLAHLH